MSPPPTHTHTFVGSLKRSKAQVKGFWNRGVPRIFGGGGPRYPPNKLTSQTSARLSLGGWKVGWYVGGGGGGGGKATVSIISYQIIRNHIKCNSSV